MKQTNIEQFRIREHGQYKGYTEGRACWLENLESHIKGRQPTTGNKAIRARDEDD